MYTAIGPVIEIEPISLRDISGKSGNANDVELLRAAAAINLEDMIHIDDIEDLKNSPLLYGAFAVSQTGVELVGTVRQKQDFYVHTDSGDVQVAEVASLWVDEKMRGYKIGPGLVSRITEVMHILQVTPVAVCNTKGLSAFVEQGYHPVGTIYSEEDEKLRTVVMYGQYANPNDLTLSQMNQRQDLIAGISAQERFKGMQPLEN